MKTIAKVPLCNLAEVSAGQGAPQGTNKYGTIGHPFVRAGSLESLINGMSEAKLPRVSHAVADDHGLRLYPAGTVVFAKSGMSSTRGLIYTLKVPCYLVSHLAALIPGDALYSRYLEFWLNRHSPAQLINDSGYPSIRLSEIGQLRILAPPIGEQKRIASILDKADAIRRKRRQAIALADNLLRSTFLDMFGDPGANPFSWPVVTMDTIVSDTQYGTSEKSHAHESGVPVLRMNNITYDGRWVLNDLKWSDMSAGDLQKYTVCKGDMLFNRTNSPELVGKTAVWERDDVFAFAGYLIRIRFNADALPEYVSCYLNSEHGKRYLAMRAKPAINMSNISASEFLKLEVPRPPVELQRRFRDRYYKIRQHREMQCKALIPAEQLYESLQSNCFAGKA